MKTIHEDNVRPYLEYGSFGWVTTAKSNQQVLDKKQNQTLRIITETIKSAPIKTTERVTNMPLLDNFGCNTKYPNSLPAWPSNETKI